jgi:SagB-type dehydrogenase family enzyme
MMRKTLLILLLFMIMGGQLGVMTSLATQLPQPHIETLNLEQAISRRKSIRSWQPANITSQELATILWAANGYAQNAFERTTLSINETYPIILFVVNASATYRYIPLNHSLVHWNTKTKTELIDLGCWPYYGNDNVNRYASAVLILVWNTLREENPYFAHVDIGSITQNIYLAANAIGLGTVAQSGIDAEKIRDNLELTSDYLPLLTMPLGYPLEAYPVAGPNTLIVTGNLPFVTDTSVDLDSAIKNTMTSRSWNDTALTVQDVSNLMWAAYGYTNVTHYTYSGETFHRTVPSAHGTYPMILYTLNASGTYRYEVNSHNLQQITGTDHRSTVASAMNAVWAAEAPILVLIAFNATHPPEAQAEWPLAAYIETGLIAQEIQLMAAALDLSTALVGSPAYNGTAAASIRSALILSPNEIPLLIQPVGHPPTVALRLSTDQLSWTADQGVAQLQDSFATYNSGSGQGQYNVSLEGAIAALPGWNTSITPSAFTLDSGQVQDVDVTIHCPDTTGSFIGQLRVSAFDSEDGLIDEQVIAIQIHLHAPTMEVEYSEQGATAHIYNASAITPAAPAIIDTRIQTKSVLEIMELSSSCVITVQTLSTPPIDGASPPEGYVIIGNYLNITVTPSITANAILKMYYTLSELSDKAVHENDLRIYRWSGEWIATDSHQDISEHWISTSTTGFSYWVVMSSPSDDLSGQLWLIIPIIAVIAILIIVLIRRK